MSIMSLDELWEYAASHPENANTFALLVVAGEIRALREVLANPLQQVTPQRQYAEAIRRSMGFSTPREKTFEEAKAEQDAVLQRQAEDLIAQGYEQARQEQSDDE